MDDVAVRLELCKLSSLQFEYFTEYLNIRLMLAEAIKYTLVQNKWDIWIINQVCHIQQCKYVEMMHRNAQKNLNPPRSQLAKTLYGMKIRGQIGIEIN